MLSLTRPSGTAPMDGPAPTDDGDPIAPYDHYGHDLLYWLDRMVRSRHQLVERLALVFHDWFATSNDAVGSARLMLDQTNLFRANGLGSFKTMVRAITQDPAMILFLDLASNRKGAINENYARELMELFTLGADRGAYTENDVRELARSLSGWDYDWSDRARRPQLPLGRGRPLGPGLQDRVRQDRALDVGGRRAAWSSSTRSTRRSSSRSCGATSSRPRRTPARPRSSSSSTSSSGYAIRPVLEAILCSPQLYDGPADGQAADRVRGRACCAPASARSPSNSWNWVLSGCGQVLYYPPDVSGWDDKRWLDTNTTLGRWEAVVMALEGDTADPSAATTRPRRPTEALEPARDFWGAPTLTTGGVAALDTFARRRDRRRRRRLAARVSARTPCAS